MCCKPWVKSKRPISSPPSIAPRRRGSTWKSNRQFRRLKQEWEAFFDWLDEVASQNAAQNLDLDDKIECYTWPKPGALDLSGAGREPKDNMSLACAVEGEAQYLVSSEDDLLQMRSFRTTSRLAMAVDRVVGDDRTK